MLLWIVIVKNPYQHSQIEMYIILLMWFWNFYPIWTARILMSNVNLFFIVRKNMRKWRNLEKKRQKLKSFVRNFVRYKLVLNKPESSLYPSVRYNRIWFNRVSLYLSLWVPLFRLWWLISQHVTDNLNVIVFFALTKSEILVTLNRT